LKAFVTGGTGFIGTRVVDMLLERGDQVAALVRSEAAAEKMRRRGALPVIGNIMDQSSMVDAMRGSDAVFHIAGWYKIGSRQQEEAETINVEGTRQVLELAVELGVPRIVYTSTIAVFGDTRGQLVDESYRPPAGQPFLTEYDRTKWKAHYEIAEPLIQRGAPIIIVMPGGVYGPGDPSLVGEILRWYLRGWLPLLPGADTTLTFAHVDDIARGHLLAAERGKPGEAYILAGLPLTMRELTQMASVLTGRPAPRGEIPRSLLQPLAPLMAQLARYLPVPGILSRDAIAILDVTYIASPAKAQSELGWEVRGVREGLAETLDWMMGQTSAPLISASQRKQAAGLALLAGMLGLAVWLLTRRRS
jgi:dihydroflavonol-4-reductase